MRIQRVDLYDNFLCSLNGIVLLQIEQQLFGSVARRNKKQYSLGCLTMTTIVMFVSQENQSLTERGTLEMLQRVDKYVR